MPDRHRLRKRASQRLPQEGRQLRVALTVSQRWVNHIVAFPFGTAAFTYLIANLFGSGEWFFWRDWQALGSAATYGGLAYAVVAALVDLAIRVVGKIRDSGYQAGLRDGREEGHTASLNQGKLEGKEVALTAAWRVASSDDEKRVVRLAAADLGINLPGILGQPHATVRVEVISPWDVLWRRLADKSTQLRERLDVQSANEEIERMLNTAAKVAVSDFSRQVDRFCETHEAQG